jgi:polyphosphate glucokinase
VRPRTVSGGRCYERGGVRAYVLGVAYTKLLGVDVGGTGVKAARVDLRSGEPSGRERVLTPHPATPDAVVSTIVLVLERFPDTTGPFGCTMPAVVTNGTVRTATNIDPTWIGTNAEDLLTEATGRPCKVLNDADAAGIAEVHHGCAQGVSGLVVMVTLGTGVGTALFINGTLVPNTELGHLEIAGKIADTWASVTTKDTHNLAWKEWSKRVNAYLTRLHALLWPEVIVLGGGIVKQSEKFIDRLDPGCEVRIAKLGNNAGIVGAALAAADAGLVPSEA